MFAFFRISRIKWDFINTFISHYFKIRIKCHDTVLPEYETCLFILAVLCVYLFIYWLFLCAYFMSTQYRIVLFTSMSVTLYSRVAIICNTWFNYKERCMWSTYCIYFYHVSQNKLWLYLKQHQPGDLVVEALYSWDSNCKFKCYLNGFSDCYCCL
jgi:hypothetical protein